MASKSSRWRDVVHFQHGALIGAIAVLILFFSWYNRHFFTVGTARVIANRIPDLLVVTVGMTFVLLVGGIDLSVGSVAALSGAVLGWLLVDMDVPMALAVAGAVGTGVLCGLFNGGITVAWNLPSFIVTLGMLEIARGAAYVVTASQTKYFDNRLEGFSEPIPAIGLSAMFVMSIALVVVGELVLRGTVFGRHVLAVGSNETAARLSGISPGRIRCIVFAISGALAGLGGLMQSALLSTADPNAGTGMELAAIAAVVIGGTSLTGGRGSVIGSFLGVLIVAILQTGLVQMGASEPVKRIVTGGVIVVAVIGDIYRQRMSRAGAVVGSSP